MAKKQDKPVKNLCVYLLKNNRDSLDDYIKPRYQVDSVGIKEKFGIDGKIFYPTTQTATPKWKEDIIELADADVEVGDNASNRAVLICNIDESSLAITFGYGRSLLREEDIERNFGLKVALSVIDPQKIKSVNTATFEDMVVTSQFQASEHTSQDEFGLDTISNIFRGVVGIPTDDRYGHTLAGKDMLKASVSMTISELAEKLRLYIEAYKSENYKNNEFGWIDNVNEVKDGLLIDELNSSLLEHLERKETDFITLSPPDTVDWENTLGLSISGAGKDLREQHDSVDIDQYLDSIKDVSIEKLKRHKLMICNSDGTEYTASSIFNALVASIELEEKKYILCMGSWYAIHIGFYEKVIAFVDSIERKDDLLPDCTFDKEGEYNTFVAESNKQFCLMDKKLYRVENATSGIEACDLFSSSKQFIHVKMETRSSLLSHLFAQGRVSYQSFISDQTFAEKLKADINDSFGENIITDDANKYEVIYAIITKKKGTLSKIIPFFSAVTLMQTAKLMNMMNVACSVCVVDQKCKEIKEA